MRNRESYRRQILDVRVQQLFARQGRAVNSRWNPRARTIRNDFWSWYQATTQTFLSNMLQLLQSAGCLKSCCCVHLDGVVDGNKLPTASSLDLETQLKPRSRFGTKVEVTCNRL